MAENENRYGINPDKKEVIEVDGQKYSRFAIKTHVITDQDNMVEVVKKYAQPLLQPGDTLFITEKAVACTQHRAIHVDDIHPRWLARFLVKFVYKNPYGIGLSMPCTMEMAIQECGTIRILFAAAISAIGKLFGKRGWFYNIAGYKARSIDGPSKYNIPPYNNYVVLGPDKPDETAAEISQAIGGFPVAITDINDLEGQILGTSSKDMNRKKLVAILKDNPLGQSNESTPLGIIRPYHETVEEASPVVEEVASPTAESAPEAPAGEPVPEENA